jgi:AraC family transcriptional regulator
MPQPPRQSARPARSVDADPSWRRPSARTAASARLDPLDRSATHAWIPPSAALHRLRLDRGQSCDAPAWDASAAPLLAAVGRAASLDIAGQRASFWFVLRGSAQLQCQEGRFQLQAGEWIALDRESHPAMQAGRNGLVVVLVLPASARADAVEGCALCPGRGLATRRDRRLALRAWREAGVFASTLETGLPPESAALRRILQLVAGLQDALEPLLQRCPGRSLRRRRQVLARMQRARLYLDGHLGRNVRLSELARLTIFSTWYFTKTFHAVYDEGPREVMSRLRLRQASTLLLQSDLSIAEVGEACGFENPCSFARAFRAGYGMTASVYRCAHKRA